MAVPISRIPAVKAKLKTRFDTDAAIGVAGIPTLYGLNAIGQTDLGREFILLGWTRDEDPTNGSGNFRGGWSSAALGRGRVVEERFVLECAIVRLEPGMNGQQACTERAFEIFQLVVANLVDWNDVVNPPCDALVRWAFICRVAHEEGRPTEDFRTIVNFDIACSARLTGAAALPPPP